MKYTHIVWDFNGTILDDLQPCLNVLNTMLAARGLAPRSKEQYKEVFGFPIKSYYEAVGFDFEKENYDVLADEWAALYIAESKESALCKGVAEAFDYFKSNGVPQVILSATEQNMLNAQLDLLGVKHYFVETLALGNLYAFSKVALGKAWVERVKPEKALFIGDTLHDFETASAMGIDCVLIDSGHQSKERLKQAGVPVYDSVFDLLDALK